MRISVSLVWFNGMGGHPAISYAGEFLLLGRSDHYGSAFEKMEFYPHIPSSERSAHLETLWTRFDERIRDLPKVWIKRKLRRVEFAYMSACSKCLAQMSNCRLLYNSLDLKRIDGV